MMSPAGKWKILIIFVMQVCIWSVSGEDDCDYDPTTVDKNIDKFFLVGLTSEAGTGENFDGLKAHFFVIHNGAEKRSNRRIFTEATGVMESKNVRLLTTAHPKVFFAIGKAEASGSVKILITRINYEPEATTIPMIELTRTFDNISNSADYSLDKAFVMNGYIINLKPCLVWKFAEDLVHLKLSVAACTRADVEHASSYDFPGEAIAKERNFPGTYIMDGKYYFEGYNTDQGKPVGVETCVKTFEDIADNKNNKITIKFANGQEECFISNVKFQVQFRSPVLSTTVTSQQLCKEGFRHFHERAVEEERSNVTAPNIQIDTNRDCALDLISGSFKQNYGLIGAAAAALVSTFIAIILFTLGMIGRVRYQRHKKEKIEVLGSAAFTVTEATTMTMTVDQSQMSQIGQSQMSQSQMGSTMQSSMADSKKP